MNPQHGTATEFSTGVSPLMADPHQIRESGDLPSSTPIIHREEEQPEPQNLIKISSNVAKTGLPSIGHVCEGEGCELVEKGDV